jgi:hypothetical protein
MKFPELPQFSASFRSEHPRLDPNSGTLLLRSPASQIESHDYERYPDISSSAFRSPRCVRFPSPSFASTGAIWQKASCPVWKMAQAQFPAFAPLLFLRGITR